jgi:hypothetical protein
MKIIASMTTIPSRINLIRPVIDAVLSQSANVEHLELNVPHICQRTKEEYQIPEWLLGIPKIKLFRTDDLGSITKIAPTLLRHRRVPDQYLWSVDDDIAYPKNQLALLLVRHDPNKKRILTRHGGNFKDDGSIQFMYGDATVDMFEGYGGVLYPPDCIFDDFDDYVKTTSQNLDCRKSDDLVLSYYFRMKRIAIYLFNRPYAETPWMPTGIQPYSNDQHALSLIDGGHLERYKRVHRYLYETFPTTAANNDPKRGLGHRGLGGDLFRDHDPAPASQIHQPHIAKHMPTTSLARNAPCFCGSGKKYKHCHGRLA